MDFLARARHATREAFVAACPFHFLVGRTTLESPRVPRRTEVWDPSDLAEQTSATKVQGFVGSGDGMLVFAVRKVKETFPSMITVGRTANNDVVIADINISRFHAFFRVHPGRIELADAGSANGTRVGGARLEPKGPAVPVALSDRIDFGHLSFVFLDAGGAWDCIRGLTDG